MNNKNTEEHFEFILENPTESEISDTEIDMKELEATRGLDKLLWKAIPARPIPSSKLDNFIPYKTKRTLSLPPLQLLTVAAVVIIVVAASLVLMTLIDDAPKGDPHKLKTLMEDALNESVEPADLAIHQQDLITYLSDNFGDFKNLDSEKLSADLNAAWKKSCAAYEKTEMELISKLDSHGEKLLRIEGLSKVCQGTISQNCATVYREELAASKELIKASFKKWRNGGMPDSSWATNGWEPAKRLFVNATDSDKSKVWMSYRAFVDGAAYDDLTLTYSKVPRHLLLPLAELASLTISREFTLSTDLIKHPDILFKATEYISPKIAKRDEKAISSTAILFGNPLYSIYYLSPGALPSKLRTAIRNVDSFFQASEYFLSRNGFDARIIVSPLLSSFEINAQLLIAISPDSDNYRLSLMAQNATKLTGDAQEEYLDFITRVNFFRFAAGLPQIVTVFHHPKDTEELSAIPTSLKANAPNIDVFVKFLSSDFNRCHAVFSGTSEGSLISLFAFSEPPKFSLPDNYKNQESNSDIPLSPTGDEGGEF